MTVSVEIHTERLTARRPLAADATTIFQRYASDPEVGRFLAWPTHRSLEDTRAFIEFSDSQWKRAGVGPLLVFRADSGELIGGAGLDANDDDEASTGYVLARDAWGYGYATEILRGVCDWARERGYSRVTSVVHPEHVASRRVLEKAGFLQLCLLSRAFEFPNLAPGHKLDVLRYCLEL